MGGNVPPGWNKPGKGQGKPKPDYDDGKPSTDEKYPSMNDRIDTDHTESSTRPSEETGPKKCKYV